MIAAPLPPARFWGLTAAGAAAFVGLLSAAALAGITSRAFLPAPWDALAGASRTGPESAPEKESTSTSAKPVHRKPTPESVTAAGQVK